MFPIPFNFPFIKKNGERTTIGDAINAGGGGSQYTLPTASASVKGGVKIGSGLTMTGEVLSNDNPTPYSLPTASAETLGGVKVGSGLSITDGVLSATGGSGGGTQLYYKDFDLTFSDYQQIGTSGIYRGNSQSINVTGYIPVSCTVTDNYTGYHPMACISKNGTSANATHAIELYAPKSSSASSFSARVYYMKSDALTPIPTT